MAIWQFRLILLPEKALLSKYEILPLTIPEELVEDCLWWWSEVQPPKELQDKIGSILPPTASWSTSMLMWGENNANEACVVYADESLSQVEEICFSIDARTESQELIHRICRLAQELGCFFLRANYELLAPDAAMVLAALSTSTAMQFVRDPVTTLKNLDHRKFEKI